MVVLTEEQLSELKQIELNMLKEFIAVCEKLGLRYYLMEGTLLGAVRHGGFIPWDDDIDVGMPREDYMRFLRDGKTYLPENLFIQTRESDPEYSLPFAKIRNSNTTYVEKLSRHLKINHGVFIDIYPIDYYPENELQQKWFEIRTKLYQKRISTINRLEEDRNFKRNLTDALIVLLLPNSNSVYQKREKMIRSVRKSNLIYNYSGYGPVPAEWYGEGVKVLFEGLQLTAPTEYVRVLEMSYGDYLKLPPIEERIGHHFVEYIDLHKPYTDYLNLQSD